MGKATLRLDGARRCTRRGLYEVFAAFNIERVFHFNVQVRCSPSIAGRPLVSFLSALFPCPDVLLWSRQVSAIRGRTLHPLNGCNGHLCEIVVCYVWLHLFNANNCNRSVLRRNSQFGSDIACVDQMIGIHASSSLNLSRHQAKVRSLLTRSRPFRALEAGLRINLFGS